MNFKVTGHSNKRTAGIYRIFSKFRKILFSFIFFKNKSHRFSKLLIQNFKVLLSIRLMFLTITAEKMVADSEFYDFFFNIIIVFRKKLFLTCSFNLLKINTIISLRGFWFRIFITLFKKTKEKSYFPGSPIKKYYFLFFSLNSKPI